MKHIYAVETAEELFQYQEFVRKITPDLERYVRFLQEKFQVSELPRAIIWTNLNIATNLISDIPVPAYTNEFRVVMTPGIDTWRGIYLKQLDSVVGSEQSVRQIRDYYNNALSQNNVMQILGHELAHHSGLFLDDFQTYGSNGTWFEEGMVEYISRHYFLTQAEFEAEAHINQQLVVLLRNQYGDHSLEEFGKSTYKGDFASIFFEYWRSFLAIKQIIENHDGDIYAVFRSYHKWNETASTKTLPEWFGIHI